MTYENPADPSARITVEPAPPNRAVETVAAEAAADAEAAATVEDAEEVEDSEATAVMTLSVVEDELDLCSLISQITKETS